MCGVTEGDAEPSTERCAIWNVRDHDAKFEECLAIAVNTTLYRVQFLLSSNMSKAQSYAQFLRESTANETNHGTEVTSEPWDMVLSFANPAGKTPEYLTPILANILAILTRANTLVNIFTQMRSGYTASSTLEKGANAILKGAMFEDLFWRICWAPDFGIKKQFQLKRCASEQQTIDVDHVDLHSLLSWSNVNPAISKSHVLARSPDTNYTFDIDHALGGVTNYKYTVRV